MPTCARCGRQYQESDGFCPTCAASCQKRRSWRVVALGVILVFLLICALILAFGVLTGALYEVPT